MSEETTGPPWLEAVRKPYWATTKGRRGQMGKTGRGEEGER
jgi:hypothetical protein